MYEKITGRIAKVMLIFFFGAVAGAAIMQDEQKPAKARRKKIDATPDRVVTSRSRRTPGFTSF